MSLLSDKEIIFDRAISQLTFVDIDSIQYLDFECNQGFRILGYQNISIENAIIDQLHKGLLDGGNYKSSVVQDFEAELLKNSSLDAVFACESKSDAISLATHTALHYFQKKYSNISHNVIVLQNKNISYSSLFNKDCKYAEINNIDSVKKNISKDIYAVILRPDNQTEVDKTFFRDLRRLCDEHDMAMIVDESMYPHFRHGKCFMHQNFSIIPDTIITNNAISNGITSFFCIMKNRFLNQSLPKEYIIKPSQLISAIGLEVLKLCDTKEFQNNIGVLNILLEQYAQKLQQIHKDTIEVCKSINSSIFITFKSSIIKTHDLAVIAQKNGLLFQCINEKTIALNPPLIATERHIATAIEILSESISQMEILGR